MMRRPVLYLRNDHLDTLGLIERALAGEGVSLAVVDAFRNEAEWPDLGDLSGVIVGGGEVHAGALEAYPHLAREHILIRRAVREERPLLGICLGAQLLAGALGSSVHPAPVTEVGFFELALTDEGRRDVLLAAFDEGSWVFHWHEDTFDLPPGAVLLAAGRSVLNQAYRVGPRAWGVQFHPEMTEDELELWIEDSGDRLEAIWGRTAGELRAEARRHLPAHQERAGELLAAFVRELG
jgi:GMP synthase (glutamine-hydrolysing)